MFIVVALFWRNLIFLPWGARDDAAVRPEVYAVTGGAVPGLHCLCARRAQCWPCARSRSPWCSVGLLAEQRVRCYVLNVAGAGDWLSSRIRIVVLCEVGCWKAIVLDSPDIKRVLREALRPGDGLGACGVDGQTMQRTVTDWTAVPASSGFQTRDQATPCQLTENSKKHDHRERPRLNPLKCNRLTIFPFQATWPHQESRRLSTEA